jgi:hypothetical protein
MIYIYTYNIIYIFIYHITYLYIYISYHMYLFIYIYHYTYACEKSFQNNTSTSARSPNTTVMEVRVEVERVGAAILAIPNHQLI